MLMLFVVVVFVFFQTKIACWVLAKSSCDMICWMLAKSRCDIAIISNVGRIPLDMYYVGCWEEVLIFVGCWQKAVVIFICLDAWLTYMYYIEKSPLITKQ